MLTTEVAIKLSLNFIDELRNCGYTAPKAVLFGSFASYKSHAHSDIDLAIWDKKFSGCLSADYEPIKHILSRYDRIELHTFSEEDPSDVNLFSKEVQRNCIHLV